jgi:hypothetical protein
VTVWLALAAAAILAVPQPGELRTFRDWTVGCDNGRLCQAVGLMPADDPEAATMAVKRGPEAGAAPEIWITSREHRPVAVRVDGRLFPVAADAGDEATYRPRAPAAFLQALIAGRRAELVDVGGRRLAALSTAGASAALLHVDEAQRRVGTVTALVRRGPRRASTLPRPPALPVVTRAPPSRKAPARLSAAQLRKARGGNACESGQEEQPPEFHRLDARHTLALVPLACASGAYNAVAVALVIPDRAAPRPAPFDYSLGGTIEAGDEHLVVGADWDPATRRLSTFHKGRGLGDCGTGQEWVWDGARFRLVFEEAMGECRGSVDYITTWRARVR